MHQEPRVVSPSSNTAQCREVTTSAGINPAPALLKPITISFALKRFIENGERELASLVEPELSAAKARLHAEMLRKFMPDKPTFSPPLIRDVSFAECEIDERGDAEEQAKHEAGSDLLAKYDDPDDAIEPENWDGARSPRTRAQKTNITKATVDEIRSWDGRLREEKKLPAEIYSHPVQAAGLECAGNYSAAPDHLDPVDLADYFEERTNDYTPTRPYHDRVAGVMFRAKRAWKKSSDLIFYCERDGCGQVFQARQGTKYCSDNCRKRHHEEVNTRS
jgi:hypothetical protein